MNDDFAASVQATELEGLKRIYPAWTFGRAPLGTVSAEWRDEARMSVRYIVARSPTDLAARLAIINAGKETSS